MSMLLLMNADRLTVYWFIARLAVFVDLFTTEV